MKVNKLGSIDSKILIIGPSWVGDTVMAQSLFKLLKQRDATLAIDVLAPAWTFSLLSRMPEVTHAIEAPYTHGELKLQARYQLAKKLRGNYSKPIIFPNSFNCRNIIFMPIEMFFL